MAKDESSPIDVLTRAAEHPPLAAPAADPQRVGFHAMKDPGGAGSPPVTHFPSQRAIAAR